MDGFKLNKSQQKAVIHTKGPLLIIAGAGTGKTRVISEKIRYLIQEEKIKPNEILAVTYTEKGAKEMDDRISKFIRKEVLPPLISTFHGFAKDVLQANGLHIGISGDFRIVTKPEQLLMMYENFSKIPLKYYKPLSSPTSCLQDLLKLFSNLKSANISVEQYEKLALDYKLKAKNGEILPEEASRIEEEALAYKSYNQILRDNNALDFGDIIQLTYELFSKRESILKKYQKKFKYILVDEYQDTNIVQNDIINLLAKEHQNICAVGDDDQSIFHFQGASLSNILNFENTYRDTEKIVLTQNYRSGQKILDSAYELIQNNNPDRLEEKTGISKKLFSDSKTEGHIEKITCPSWEHEIKFIMETIQEKRKQGIPYNEIAVLFRSHSIGASLIPIFKNHKIPYRVIEGPGLYEQDEVRSVRNLIKFLVNPDDSLSLFDLLKSPLFDIETIILLRILNLSDKNNISLYTGIKNYIAEVEGEKLNPGETMSLFSAGLRNSDEENIKHAIKKLEELISLQTEKTAIQIIYEILYGDFAFNKYIEKTTKDELEKDQKIANLAKFYRRAEKFEYSSNNRSLKNFDSMLDVFIEAGEDPDQETINTDIDSVSLLSIHKAKGLEFNTVFIMGLAQRKFPVSNRKDRISVPDELIPSEKSPEFHKQEERRLMYVAMTRAKENLYLSYSKLAIGSSRETKPSVFFDEVNDKYTKNREYRNDNILDIKKIFELKVDDTEIEIREDLKLLETNTKISLSYSNISTYQNCPLQFKYQKIYRIPSEPKATHQFGRYIHNILEYLHRSINQGIIPSKQQLLNYYHHNWNLKNIVFLDDQHKEEYKKEGQRIINDYYDTNDKNFKKAKYLEKRFQLMINNYKITGVIDRIDELDTDGNVEVIDYKTGKAKTLQDLKKDKLSFLQLYIYAIACQDHLNLNAVKLSFYYLTDGSKVTISPTPEQLSYAEDLIRETADLIKEGNYEPKPDYFKCAMCEYNRICKATIKKL